MKTIFKKTISILAIIALLSILCVVYISPDTFAEKIERILCNCGGVDGEQTSVETPIVIDLTVAPESAAPYNRGDWSGWRSHVDRDLNWKQAPTTCKWAFYTAKEPHCMSGVDRDHLVSVVEVHQSGGHAWSNEKKKNFYNDTVNIFVMPSGENRSKGGKDFAEWRPSVNVCRYAKAYIATKKMWNLTVDQAEHDALKNVTDDCNT